MHINLCITTVLPKLCQFLGMLILLLSFLNYYLGFGHMGKKSTLELQIILVGEVQGSEHEVRRTYEYGMKQEFYS